MLPEPVVYPPTPNTIPMDPLNMGSAFTYSPAHLIPNPQVHDITFADSFSQPDSPSSSLFELFTNTDATVPTSTLTLADEKDMITSTTNTAFHNPSTGTSTTSNSTSAPRPSPLAHSHTPDTSVTSPVATSFGNNTINAFPTASRNQFFTTAAPDPSFTSTDKSAPTFTSAAKPAFTPRTINPIATNKSRAFKITKARSKARRRAYKIRRNVPFIDTPYIHIPGEPLPPTPPTAIHVYADARLSLAQVCWWRLTPILEITRMYFSAYHDSETTSWGGRTGSLLEEEKKRFKDEFLEHIATFIPQLEALKGFIELGRRDVGKSRTDFLLKGVEVMICYMKGKKGQMAKEPLEEDDMLVLHRMCSQFCQILNTEFQIKWKFHKERLVSGGRMEEGDYE